MVLHKELVYKFPSVFVDHWAIPGRRYKEDKGYAPDQTRPHNSAATRPPKNKVGQDNSEGDDKSYESLGQQR